MGNSKLASWKWSGKTDHYNVRDHKIDKITIHHMAGNATLANCCTSVQARGGNFSAVLTRAQQRRVRHGVQRQHKAALVVA